MSDFVSGGQITMHNIRMLGQVMKKLYLGAVIGFIFLGVYSFHQNTTFYDRNKLVSWLKAEIIQNFYGEGNPSLEKVTIKFMRLTQGKLKSQYKYEIVERSVPYFMRFCPEQCRMRLENKVYDSLKMGVIGSLVVVALMIIFFKRRGIATRLSKFIRGGQIASEKDLIRHIKKLNRKYKDETHKLAGIPYPYRSQEQNTLVIGSTGSGKTQLISDLVAQIRKKGERLIVYDKKGDYLSWFYKKEKDFILNPFDKRGEKWNLLNEVEHAGMLKTLAESFIPNRGERSGENKIWDESARFVFSELAKKILNKEGVCSNKALVDKILKKDLTEFVEYLKDTDAQSIMSTDSKKIAMSVIFMLTTHLNSLSLTSGEKDESFSIRKWMEGEESDSALFITNKAEFEGELAPLESAWFEIVINSILSGKQNNKKKTWIIIDELATLNKIPSLQKGLAAARSYGGCFVLGIQNISQLREIYGINSTGIISSECNTRCIFKTNDPETSKWVSDNLGQEEIIENKKSLSYGASEVRDGVNLSSNNKLRTLALPSEIQNMDRMNLYIKMVDSPVIKKGIKYVEREIVEPDLFILNEEVVDKISEIKTNVKAKDTDKDLNDNVNNEEATNNTELAKESDDHESSKISNNYEGDDNTVKKYKRFK